eukprot:364631-Chlamydomonas_euryale.AAC.8
MWLRAVACLVARVYAWLRAVACLVACIHAWLRAVACLVAFVHAWLLVRKPHRIHVLPPPVRTSDIGWPAPSVSVNQASACRFGSAPEAACCMAAAWHFLADMLYPAFVCSLQGALEEAQLITWPRPQKVGSLGGVSWYGHMPAERQDLGVSLV